MAQDRRGARKGCDGGKMLQQTELPVKVDLVDGADGLELYEIVFALQHAANSLRSSDLFRARYLDLLVAKYQLIQRKRLLQITQYYREKYQSAQGDRSSQRKLSTRGCE